MKITINPFYKALMPFIETIHSRFEQEGTLVYKGRNEIRMFNINGLKVNVKRFKVPGFLNRIIYSYIRSSKAERSYQYALRLCRKGLGTPEPIGEARLYRAGLLTTSYYLSVHEEDFTTMHSFGLEPLAGKEEIATAFVDFTVQLHLNGINHRDYSPGNILYKLTPEGYRFIIVDINRMSFGPISVKKGCAGFSRLWATPEFIKFIAGRYAADRHADPEQCLIWIRHYHQKFWTRYGRKHEMPFELNS